MNAEELQNKVKASIKNEKLREYLLECLKNECELNSLNLPLFLIGKATQRFKKKIKACQQIEIDLPDNLIASADSYIILPKLETLRLKLAMLYADGLGSITEEKSSYDGIKYFTLKSLSINFNLKLKYFDLIIKLLEQIIADQPNKELVGAVDLLKLFVNEPIHHPNERDLQYINNLGSEANAIHIDKKKDILTIRKMFYSVIRELNKKLLFQYLLNQLLKIVKNQNNSPLIQFNTIFITKCFNEVEMEADDLNQVIGLVYRSLEHYNKINIKKYHAIFKQMLNQKNLIDHLIEFEENFKERIFQPIINDSVNHNLENKESNVKVSNSTELDFPLYFPVINNEKIQAKFVKSQQVFNKSLEKNITNNGNKVLENFKWFGLIGSTFHELTANAKAIVSDAKENLEEFAETSADRLTGLLKKNSETSYPEKNKKNDEIDLNALLMQVKAKLLPIKEKLESWNLTLNPSIDQHDSYSNQIDTSQFDLNQDLALVDRLDDSINEKYKSLIQQIVTEFEKIHTAIQERDYWFEKPEIAKSSLVHKIFFRGYFNSSYTIKKIKDSLGAIPIFTDINNFFFKKNFFALLSYGVVRWPWMNKTVFAYTWAEQFCLPEIINRTNNLKNNHDSKDVLKNVISLVEYFFPYKKSENIIQILDDFKKYIAIQLRQLDALEQKISDHLNEKINSMIASRNSSPTRFFENADLPSLYHKINMEQRIALTVY